jgi:hypothetical protein
MTKRKSPTRHKSSPPLGAHSLRVSASDGQLVLEFMDGADPVPALRGQMTVASALLLARLIDRVAGGDIPTHPKIETVIKGRARSRTPAAGFVVGVASK